MLTPVKVPLNYKHADIPARAARACHDTSPFNTLSNLSELNPSLKSLSLRLNISMNTGNWELPPAATEPLFSNVFPELSHFSLTGIPAVPSSARFSAFIAAHSFLRAFTCHAFEENLKLPADALPNLEYLEGSASLIAAICDSSSTSRTKLVEICGVHGWEQELTLYLNRVFPRLPHLRTAGLQLAEDTVVTPEYLEMIGRLCPDIGHLSLHDPQWIGTMVCPRSTRPNPSDSILIHHTCRMISPTRSHRSSA